MEDEQNGEGGDHRIGEPGCQAIQAGDKRPTFSVRQFSGKASFDQMKHFRTPKASHGAGRRSENVRHNRTSQTKLSHAPPNRRARPTGFQALIRIVSRPVGHGASSQDGATDVLARRSRAPRGCSIAASASCRAAKQRRTSHQNVPLVRTADLSTDYAHERVTRIFGSRGRTRLSFSATAVHLSGGDPCQSHPWSFCAPDRSISVPNPDRCAYESLPRSDDCRHQSSEHQRNHPAKPTTVRVPITNNSNRNQKLGLISSRSSQSCIILGAQSRLRARLHTFHRRQH